MVVEAVNCLPVLSPASSVHFVKRPGASMADSKCVSRGVLIERPIVQGSPGVRKDPTVVNSV